MPTIRIDDEVHAALASERDWRHERNWNPALMRVIVAQGRQGGSDMELMVTIDGAEAATLPLIDGNDPFNNEAERGAFDRAYEFKTTSPDSVVAIVLAGDGWKDEEDEPTRTWLTVRYDVTDLDPDEVQWLSGAAEAQAEGGDADAEYPAVNYSVQYEYSHDREFIAESLELLADLDEGEHTDDERLRGLAGALREGSVALGRGDSGRADSLRELGIQGDEVLAATPRALPLGQWHTSHADDCPVTRHRADLLAELAQSDAEEGDSGRHAYLLGAVPEYDLGGDQEVELCTCDTAGRMGS